MRFLRSAWALFMLLVATLVMATLALLIGVFDRSHQGVGYISKFWAQWFLWSTGLPITVTGLENLEAGRSYLYICNHSSALDIVIALAYLPRPLGFMAKQGLFRIPLFGWSMRAMGSIAVNRANLAEARKSVDRALTVLRTKSLSMIFYPEGARTRTGKMLPFKKGVFHLALRSGMPLVPVAIKGSFKALPPGGLSLTFTPIYITIGRPIETADLTNDDREPLCRQAQSSIQALLDNT